MFNRRKISIILIALGVIGAGLYWRKPLAEAAMKLLQVAQGVIRVRSSPKNGFVGYWNFDECDSCTTAADKSGNGNTGTMYNAAGPTVGDLHTTSGKIGNGVSFDGVDDYVAVSDTPFDFSSSFSVAGWIRVPNIIANEVMIWKTTSFGINYSFPGAGGASNQFAFAMWNGVGWTGSTMGENVQLNRWYHVVGVFDDANNLIILYVDGVQKDSDSFTETPANSAFNLHFGNYDEATDAGFFNGQIDDIRIYNRALSADEVKRLYEEGNNRTTINANQNSVFNNGLVDMWSFNGPDVDWASTTAEILDRSGKGNNGDATNFGKEAVRPGIVGQALSFDGVDDYVAAPSQQVANLIGDQFVISFWVKARAGSDRPTFGFLGSGESNPQNPIASYDSFLSFGNGTGQQLMTALPEANDTSWTFYAIVDDGSNYRVYVNGAESYNATISVNPSAGSSKTFVVGQSGFSAPYDDPFNGFIDEFRVYNRAFNAAEIQELYLSAARL